MLRALKLEPEKCTGCLQCEMACSFENDGGVQSLRSRGSSVFTFHDEAGVSCPTPAPSATKRGACVPVRWTRSSSIRPYRLQGRPQGRLRRLQGLHHRVSRSVRSTTHATPARSSSATCAAATRQVRGGLSHRGNHLRRRRTATGMDRMRAWAAKSRSHAASNLTRCPNGKREELNHGLDQKNPAGELSTEGTCEKPSPSTWSGRRSHTLASAGSPRSTWSRRSDPSSAMRSVPEQQANHG